jgi:hypothetical protein
MIFIIGVPAMWAVFINMLISRHKIRNSSWKINDYHYLWVEKDDPPETEAILRQLTSIFPGSQLTITPNKSLLILALISLILLVIGLCLKNSPIMQLIIFLSGLSLLIAFLTLHYIELRNRTTWKK